MARRSVLALFVLAGSLALTPTADAQILPLFRRQGQPTASETNPEHEQKKTQAQAAYQAGDLPKTIELMDAVLRENPRDSVAYYLRGSARVGWRRSRVPSTIPSAARVPPRLPSAGSGSNEL